MYAESPERSSGGLFHRFKYVLTVASLMVATAAQAAYPEKSIQMIVAYPPGGSTDTVARALAQGLSEDLKRAVVVENRPGAGGIVGMAQAARAAPDGYNIHFAATTSQAVGDAIQSQTVNLIDDFVPIGLVGATSHALVITASLPVNNVAELVAYIKASPGKYNYASHGPGTLSHLESELFIKENGLQMTHIPYKGSAQALPDVVNGSSIMTFDSFTGSRGLVDAGKLKYLAVPTKERVSYFPDLPTLAEEGVKNIEVNNLFGLFAPKGTPREVIDTLSASIKRVSTRPDLKEALALKASELIYASPEDTGKMVAEEHRFWGEVVKAAGIK